MTRVLFVGQRPETIDYSDSAIPPGFNAEKINAGIAIAVAKIAERGWQANLCMMPPGETAGPMLEKQLASAAYDCVVIGGGLRLRRKACRCSRGQSTLSIRPRPTRSWRSTRGQRTRPKPLPAG
jgi:hypothetical protein